MRRNGHHPQPRDALVIAAGRGVLPADRFVERADARPHDRQRRLLVVVERVIRADAYVGAVRPRLAWQAMAMPVGDEGVERRGAVQKTMNERRHRGYF